jgi:predicted AlkP superfamily pyrophosphatase or phosphodiesterase
MLPGSAIAGGNKPKATYVDEFAMNIPLYKKADQILRWLDMPDDMRPQFIGAYVLEVDTKGHAHGPISKEVSCI